MKKNSLLSLVSMFTVLLTLGSCSLEDDSGSSRPSSDSSSEGASTPMELVQKAGSLCNYTVSTHVYRWISKPYLATDIDEGNYDEDELLDSMELTEYFVYGYYTEDALLIIQCDSYYGMAVNPIYQIVINNTSTLYGDTCDYYQSEDGVNWEYLGYAPNGHWQYYFDSFYDYNLYGLGNSDYAYYGSVLDENNNPVDLYYLTTTTAQALFGYMCGYDIWDIYMTYYLTAYDDFIYFYPNSQTIDVYYYSQWFYSFDENSEYIYLFEDDYASTISDVGTTNIDSYVASAKVS